MKAHITSKRRRPHTDRFINKGFNVYTQSNISELVDNWFNDNELRSVPFKSKAWSKVMRATNSLNIKALRGFFGVNCDITFSHYAGCSMCPCSPGFRIRKCTDDRLNEYFNNDVSMKIEASDNELAQLKVVLDKAKTILEKEIAEHAIAA